LTAVLGIVAAIFAPLVFVPAIASPGNARLAGCGIALAAAARASFAAASLWLAAVSSRPRYPTGRRLATAPRGERAALAARHRQPRRGAAECDLTVPPRHGERFPARLPHAAKDRSRLPDRRHSAGQGDEGEERGKPHRARCGTGRRIV
jgi:hypothetical protein